MVDDQGGAVGREDVRVQIIDRDILPGRGGYPVPVPGGGVNKTVQGPLLPGIGPLERKVLF